MNILRMLNKMLIFDSAAYLTFSFNETDLCFKYWSACYKPFVFFFVFVFVFVFVFTSMRAAKDTAASGFFESLWTAWKSTNWKLSNLEKNFIGMIKKSNPSPIYSGVGGKGIRQHIAAPLVPCSLVIMMWGKHGKTQFFFFFRKIDIEM